MALPELDLDVEAATLTGPLADELEKLQEDLKKAEEAVRNDVRIDLRPGGRPRALWKSGIDSSILEGGVSSSIATITNVNGGLRSTANELN